jgi:hypothetical protein
MQALYEFQAEALRERIVEAVRGHWVRPRFLAGPYAVPAGREEEVARAVLDAMLTRPFRVGALPPPDVYDALLERVRRRVRRGQPIYVTQGYAPLKNLNVVTCSRADWAEFFALCHLAAWHNKVQAVYPPGLRIQMAFDDATLTMANHADRRAIDSYITSIRQLIPALGLDGLITGTVRHSSFAWLFHFGLYQLAGWRVRRWERDPAHRPQIERMEQFARRNVVLPPGLSPGEQERYVRDASHRYRVYWEALQLSGITRSKGRIISMYLDGHQHHLRQPVALHLTSVDKGQVTQPWQGEGALLDNGHGKLVPFVLTGGRRSRYRTGVVDGLDLVPLPGFDRIVVAAEPAAADESADAAAGTAKGPHTS